MGMDVEAVLIYGLKMPEDANWEDIEDIFYPYDPADQNYPNLDFTSIGTCENPEFIVGGKTTLHRVYWTSQAINLDALVCPLNELEELKQFADDMGLKHDFNWYFGCYCSY